MANDDVARGLVPLNVNGKGTVNAHYYICDTATDLYIGMPVAPSADGEVAPVEVSGSNGLVLGAIVGFSYSTSTNVGQSVGSHFHEGDPFVDVSDLGDQRVYALVADDPEQEYVIQGDTGGTAVTAAGIFTGASLIYRATSGNTNSGFANLELDQSSIATGTGGLVQILRFQDSVQSDGTANSSGNYAKFVVRLLRPAKSSGSNILTLGIV